jgi:hypothetical protein
VAVVNPIAPAPAAVTEKFVPDVGAKLMAPVSAKVATSYVERQNLTMRMSMRRFTRLTNAFSKKIENLEAAVALHFMYYNFCRPHRSLNIKKNIGMTPAMAAGVAKKPWKIEDIVNLTIQNK